MSKPKWLVIAKSKYYTLTGSFRKIRLLFPFLVTGALAVFVWYAASAVAGLLLDEVRAFFFSQVAVVMVQVVLFMFFFMFVSIPVASTLRDINLEQQCIFLKAPVRSSDILLGEFLGELPLYAIVITIVAGFFTAFLDPLSIDVAQKSIIIFIFLITLSSALWIGTVIAALLRTKLGKSASGKDMGKAFSIIIILPFVAFLYAFLSGSVFRVLSDPETSSMVRAILRSFPSSWGAEIISDLASNPGDSGAVGLEIVTRLGGLIVFFVVIVWIGVRLADRAYSLDATTFTVAKANPDSAFYRIITYLGGGGSFGTLLVSTFKIYTRRLHNLSWLTYVVCLAALISMFSHPAVRPDKPLGIIAFSSIVFPALAAVVTSDVTIWGKENLLIYKKVPSGVETLIETRLIQSWLTVIPIGVVLVAIAAIRIQQATIATVLIHMGVAMLTTAAYVVFALGLFLLNPVYSEKGGLYGLNMMIIVLGLMVLCFGCLFRFGEIQGTELMILLSWIVGIALLLCGKRRLSKME